MVYLSKKAVYKILDYSKSPKQPVFVSHRKVWMSEPTVKHLLWNSTLTRLYLSESTFVSNGAPSGQKLWRKYKRCKDFHNIK